jgi:hypothetical protein
MDAGYARDVTSGPISRPPSKSSDRGVSNQMLRRATNGEVLVVYGGGHRIRARLEASWRAFASAPGAWSFRAMTAFCLAIGFWLRARGFLYDVPSMWVDECGWAMMLMDLPLRELLIRPPAFMALSKVLAATFGPTEMALRSLPWLGGLLALIVSPLLARRLFTAPAARLLFVAIIALHPVATDFSKEFKPYSLSLALHLVLMLFTLRYVTERRKKDLAFLLGSAAIGVLFAQDLLFALPSVFLLIGWSAFKEDRRHLRAIVLVAVVIIATLLLQYFLIWSKLPKDETAYWANKYNVFYVDSPARSHFSWLADKYARLAAFPGYHYIFWGAPWLPEEEWPNIVRVAQTLWQGLHFFGLFMFLWHRRARAAILILLPLVVLIAFNWLGFWPFGIFRANAFLVVYFGAIAAMAFDAPANARRPAFGLVPAALLVVIPLFFFEEGSPPTKRCMTRTSEFPALLGWLRGQAPEPSTPRKQVVILTSGSCELWNYSLKYHPQTQWLYRRIKGNFEARCVDDGSRVLGELRSAIESSGRPVWLIRRSKPFFERQPDLKTVQSVRFDVHLLSEWDKRRTTKREVREPELPREALHE